ncbi:MAG: Plug domain-containing protein, partial [Bacteroidetes bacterium]|nr:Plug domain-containing protein [Bacteroidota bacterium]
MLSKCFILLIVIFGSSFNVLSQNFKGRILSVEDSLPIEGVKLFNGKTLLTSTNKEGLYTLETKENIYIEFRHPSYYTIGLNSEGLPLTVYMQQMPQALDQVVVTAGKREQKIGEVTVSIEVLKPEKLIENNNSVKLDAAVENIPGLNVINGQANIRGGSGFSYGAGSRVLMLVDGLPMISADANDIKWDAIPLENIERVEVIKGAASAMYGSGALNGIIHLKTAEAGAKPLTKLQVFNGVYDNPKDISQKFWSGSRGSSGLSFLHSQKYKSIDFTIGAYYLNDQGYRVSENFITKRITGSLK